MPIRCAFGNEWSTHLTWFSDFPSRQHHLDEGPIHYRVGGKPGAPPLLLLHGFPQTHAIWHRMALLLQDRFQLVMPDLRGYGDSLKPPGLSDHRNYSKRAMATDMVGLMRALGHERFAVCGHDRGGRVAHRMALDHPQAVSKLCLIDIAPTLDMYDATNMDFARAYYHWFHLIQPHPLPETMIGGSPKAYLHAKLGGWGAAGLAHLEPQAVREYERCFCTAEAIHAACEDYRASAGIDLEHDRASRAQGQRIACETLVVWGSRGVVHKLFDPMALWQAQCALPIQGQVLDAGHFIPEERPQEISACLAAFMAGQDPAGVAA